MELAANQVSRLRTLFQRVTVCAALVHALSCSASAEEPVSLDRVFFVMSPTWYVLKNQALDDDVLVFRKYSLSIIDGSIAGPDKAKNILDFGCHRTNRYADYVVFHFPDWASGPPDKSDWKPRLPLNIGINNLSTTFDAEGELKNRTIFIDLNDRHKMNLLKMITAQSIVLDYGKNDARLRIEQRTLTPDGKGDIVKLIDDFVRQFLAPSVGAGKITSYDVDRMLAACLVYKRRGVF